VWDRDEAYGAARAYNPRTGARAATYQASTPYAHWGETVVRRNGKWAHTGHYADDDVAVRGYRTSEGGKGIAFASDDGDDPRGVAVRTSEGGKAIAFGTDDDDRPGGALVKGRDDDLYVGRDGNVYKRDDDGQWHRRDDDQWQKVDQAEQQKRRAEKRAERQPKVEKKRAERQQQDRKAAVQQLDRDARARREARVQSKSFQSWREGKRGLRDSKGRSGSRRRRR
jgi:hypothetical protein